MKWAKDHQNWTLRQWDTIIWSDESKFELMAADTKSRVLRQKGEEFHSTCLERKTMFCASVMVWGCMSSRGVGNLHIIDGTVNALKYENILEEHLIPSIPLLQSSEGEYIFQQDGAPCHTANRIKTWFHNKKINTLEWPASSPDLSPIETLWGKMKKELKSSPPNTLEDLKSKLRNVWENISPEICRNLVHTLPQRIKAVIKQKGDATWW